MAYSRIRFEIQNSATMTLVQRTRRSFLLRPYNADRLFFSREMKRSIVPLPVLALKAQAETTPGIGNPVLRVQFAQL